VATRGWLEHVAMVPAPAYEVADVLSVRDWRELISSR
jgi:hypothetical protein